MPVAAGIGRRLRGCAASIRNRNRPCPTVPEDPGGKRREEVGRPAEVDGGVGLTYSSHCAVLRSAPPCPAVPSPNTPHVPCLIIMERMQASPAGMPRRLAMTKTLQGPSPFMAHSCAGCQGPRGRVLEGGFACCAALYDREGLNVPVTPAYMVVQATPQLSALASPCCRGSERCTGVQCTRPQHWHACLSDCPARRRCAAAPSLRFSAVHGAVALLMRF